MDTTSNTAELGRRPLVLGAIVAFAGLLACFAPAFILVNGFYGLPVVVVWALVYAYAPNAAGRWPLWVLGQWLSLTAVFAVVAIVMGNDGGMPASLALIPAGMMTVTWMVLVGMMTAHRHFWVTRRPPVEDSASTAPVDVYSDHSPTT